MPLRRILRRALLGAILAGTIGAPALAEVVSSAPESASVTIYRDRPGVTRKFAAGSAASGLALITETRTIDVPAGQSRISFRGVADGIVPETAKIEGLPARLVEYNFDYDLMSPGSLVFRSIGKHVRLVRTEPKTGKVTDEDAVIRSGPDGVMLEVGGKLEALGCSGAPEKLVFDQIPQGLADKPTLSLIARAAAPGRYKVRLSYLATGFDWSADYVARIAPDGRKLDLSGWITLVNQGDVSFPKAPTAVVAGRWNRVPGDGTDRARPTPIPVTLSCWPLDIDWATHLPPPLRAPRSPLTVYEAAAAPPPNMVAEAVVTGARMAKMSELGDYKLYTLPEPTTVAARQTKQVQLLDQPGVPFKRLYGYSFSLYDSSVQAGRPEPARVLLRLENKADAGLGKPLPAGTISVMQPDAQGRLILAGEKRLDDIPVGLPLDIELGGAMDVYVKARIASREGAHLGNGSPRHVRIAVEAVISNAKSLPVTFEFRHPAPGEDFKVVAESDPHALKNGGPIWTFVLAPGERRVLTYTFEQVG
jgi:hypothetical protein